MNQVNRKKRKLSITISQQLQSKINHLIKIGKFASTSDAINIAVAEFIGKIETLENTSFLDNETISLIEKNDHSKKENISISFSEYINDELEIISELMDKPKSYIIRLALINFFEKYYQEPNIIHIDNNSNLTMPTTPQELEDFIFKTIQKIDRK